MLKSDVCVNGLVTRAAVTKTNSEGKSFVTFGLRVDVPTSQGSSIVLDISVSRDGNDVSCLVLNARVEVKGILTFKKRGDKMYLNLHAAEVNPTPASTTDMISGTLSFRGSLGKTVDSKTDKNGKPYLLFSGFSTEKVAIKREQSESSLSAMSSNCKLGEAKVEENFEYTWVRFVLFGENAIIKPQAKVEITGEMELSVYNERLNISCRVSEAKEWIRQPYTLGTPQFTEQPETEQCPL